MGSTPKLLRALVPIVVLTVLGGALVARAGRHATDPAAPTSIPEIDQNPDPDRLTVRERGLVYIYWLAEEREELCELDSAGEMVRDVTFVRPDDTRRLRERLLQQWRVTRLDEIPAARRRDDALLRSLGYL